MTRLPFPKIRTLRKQRRKPAPKPLRTQRPWAGYSAHDSLRPEPLSRCPSARCRRAKQCIAAIDNLYCLRTHHTKDEQANINRASPVQRAIARVPPIDDPDDWSARGERIAEIAEIRRAHDAKMLEMWKAGAFDERFGPWRPQGIVLKPPERSYVEGPKSGVDKRHAGPYRPRRRP